MTVIRRRSATRDIDEIAEYISRDSVAAAERFLDALSDTFDMLARFPGAGSKARQPRARAVGVRQIVIKRHAFYIAYYVVGGHVEILRVMHTSRDRDTLLEAEF